MFPARPAFGPLSQHKASHAEGHWLMHRQKEHEFGAGFGANRVTLIMWMDSIDLALECPSLMRWVEAWNGVPQRPFKSFPIDPTQTKLRQSVVWVALQVLDSRDRIPDIVRQAPKRELKPIQRGHSDLTRTHYYWRLEVATDELQTREC
jgi:hypothetical protein